MMGRPGGGMARGAAMGRPGAVRPAERTKDLRGTLRRLLARLRPERAWLAAAGLLGVTSVGFLVAVPKILGSATNILFDGIVGQRLPAGLTQAQVTLVQVFGRRQAVIDQFGRQNRRMYEASFRAQFLSGIIQPSIQVLSNLNYVVIAVMGGYWVASGRISLGDVVAFMQYSRQFTMPITQIAAQMNLLQSGLASAERVFEFLDAPEEQAERAVASRGRALVAGRVTLEHVCFRYEPDKSLIEDFSLDVLPGQTVAIVGRTGAGKTTVVNLLMRFYEIGSGRITLDGADYRDLTRDQVRRCFGMVLQDTWLFAGTIRENIRYGRQDATDTEVVDAARAARADYFIRTLPDGYDTLLDEEASNISAGQRQLLTIARAFLADPPILILDEATSNVDTRTEVLIQDAMAKLRQGRTSFVIAHRLSTICHADTIVVMDDGRIVEQGDHDDLLRRRGVYYSLYTSQFTEVPAEPG
jgi:ATP-binding cassette subfamily B protein